MAILGAQMSVAGGLYRAIQRGELAGCDCVQIHIESPRRWPGVAAKKQQQGASAKSSESSRKTRTTESVSPSKTATRWEGMAIAEADARRFRETLEQSSIDYPLSHSSYMINLGTPDQELWKKSVDAFVIELQRADQLGIPYVVLHPGAYTKSSEEDGIRAVVTALDEVHRLTPRVNAKCLLETTAGQGTTLGWRFEQLAAMIDGVHAPDRVAICLDTCHVFAAGYALSDEKDYQSTMNEFDQIVGVEQIKAIHLNDSKRELGSRVDRHEHIGEGYLGDAAFANLLSDSRFDNVPMYLETPKEKDASGKDWDILNLARLRCLAKL